METGGQHGIEQGEGEGLAVVPDEIEREHRREKGYVQQYGGRAEFLPFVHEVPPIFLSASNITEKRGRNPACFVIFCLCV